jgi:hypothetical protein
MSADSLIHVAGAALRAPFFARPKSRSACGIFSRRASTATGVAPGNRPELRENLALVKGRRRLPLGCAHVAWQRDRVFRAQHVAGRSWWGIYSEDFEWVCGRWTTQKRRCP